MLDLPCALTFDHGNALYRSLFDTRVQCAAAIIPMAAVMRLRYERQRSAATILHCRVDSVEMVVNSVTLCYISYYPDDIDVVVLVWIRG